MSEAEMISAYCALNASEQASLLARLGGEVTIHGRMTYVAGTDEVADPPRLRELNELQHSLLGQLERLLADDLQRYPDDVFAQMLVAGFVDLGIGDVLVQVIEEFTARHVKQIA